MWRSNSWWRLCGVAHLHLCVEGGGKDGMVHEGRTGSCVFTLTYVTGHERDTVLRRRARASVPPGPTGIARSYTDTHTRHRHSLRWHACGIDG